MTRERLKECLSTMRWGYSAAAAWLECDERQVRRWVADPTIMPEAIALWLDRMAQFYVSNPPPMADDWRLRRKKGSVSSGGIRLDEADL